MNAILGMICEDFDFDEDIMRMNQAMLDEDASPIDVVAKIDSSDEKVKDESDETVEDIFSTLDVDSLIDRLELEEEKEERDAERLSVKLNTDEPKFRMDVGVDDEDDDKQDSTIRLNVKDQEELSVNVKNKIQDEKINVTVKENDQMKTPIKVVVKDKPDDEVEVKIKDDVSLKEPDDINLKLKSDGKDGDQDGDQDSDINIKLKNTNKEPEDKISSFINKRDELLATNNPNLQLTTCLKIIINLKKSLERLVNYIPEENTLAQTKYLVGDLLDNLMDNSTIILKDSERIKKIIYKIFDMLLSINNYIEHKYIEIEDRLDDTTKRQEDSDIHKSVHDVEVIRAFKDVAKLLGSDVADDAEDFLKNGAPKPEQHDTGSVKPVPNINRRRI